MKRIILLILVFFVSIVVSFAQETKISSKEYKELIEKSSKEWKEKQKAWKAKHNKWKQDSLDLAEQNAAFRKKNVEDNKQLGKMRGQVDSLKRTLKAQKGKSKTDLKAALERKESEHNKKIKTLKQAIDDSKKYRKNQKKQIDSLQTRLREISDSTKSYANDIKKYQGESEIMHDSISQLSDSISQLNDQLVLLDSVQKKVEDLQQTLTKSQEMLEKFDSMANEEMNTIKESVDDLMNSDLNVSLSNLTYIRTKEKIKDLKKVFPDSGVLGEEEKKLSKYEDIAGIIDDSKHLVEISYNKDAVNGKLRELQDVKNQYSNDRAVWGKINEWETILSEYCYHYYISARGMDKIKKVNSDKMKEKLYDNLIKKLSNYSYLETEVEIFFRSDKKNNPLEVGLTIDCN